MTNTPLAVAHLSALTLAPEDLVRASAAAGFDRVGFRLHPAMPGGPEYPLPLGSTALKQTQEALAATGLRVHDVEFVPVTADPDMSAIENLLTMAEALGASRVNVSGDDDDMDRLARNFGAICDRAAQRGMVVDLEFMRWRPIANLAKASELLERADRPNAAILLDVLHLFRSGGSAEELRRVPQEWLHSVQLCDAPRQAPPPEGIIEEARHHRLCAGAGELDLKGVLAALPPG